MGTPYYKMVGASGSCHFYIPNCFRGTFFMAEIQNCAVKSKLWFPNHWGNVHHLTQWTSIPYTYDWAEIPTFFHLPIHRHRKTEGKLSHFQGNVRREMQNCYCIREVAVGQPPLFSPLNASQNGWHYIWREKWQPLKDQCFSSGIGSDQKKRHPPISLLCPPYQFLPENFGSSLNTYTHMHTYMGRERERERESTMSSHSTIYLGTCIYCGEFSINVILLFQAPRLLLTYLQLLAW